MKKTTPTIGEVIEVSVSRPTRKPDEKIKGALCKWYDSGYVAFEPQVKREASPRTVLKEASGISYYRNEGEKDSSYSLHVNVASSEQDPAGAILNKVARTLNPLLKKEPRISTSRFLQDSEMLKVWHRRREKKLCIYLQLDVTLDKALISQELLRQVSEVSKIINLTKF